MEQENVNHPKHYNSHPAGIECIDIIRHYTCDIANAIKYLWRAGLKVELGKDDAEKEIEDLKKALWYIEDYKNVCKRGARMSVAIEQDGENEDSIIIRLTGYSKEEITHGYCTLVATAMSSIMCVGIISNYTVYGVNEEDSLLDRATECIQLRILDINQQLIDKEIKEMKQVLHGQAVDGEDYVSKPGGVRETEPDKYDPLNMMIIYGKAYCLDDKIRERPNGSLHTPCENCDLMEVCYKDWRHPKEEECQHLCNLHFADTNQYYREVGTCKYSPSYGTIEVVDQQKKFEAELRDTDLEESEEDD